jgi:hypothetical protein
MLVFIDATLRLFRILKKSGSQAVFCYPGHYHSGQMKATLQAAHRNVSEREISFFRLSKG